MYILSSVAFYSNSQGLWYCRRGLWHTGCQSLFHQMSSDRRTDVAARTFAYCTSGVFFVYVVYLHQWLGHVVVRALDLQLDGCEFNSRPWRCRVTILGHKCLCRLRWSSGGMHGCGVWVCRQFCLSRQMIAILCHDLCKNCWTDWDAISPDPRAKRKLLGEKTCSYYLRTVNCVQ